MSLRKLDHWVTAGLLSAGQAAAIRAHEEANDRPWLQWAAFGLGGLAILLGFAAIIASNWDAIPGALKLGVHLVITLGCAWGVWTAWTRERPVWIDLALFLFSGSLLTAIALIGQVFQLSSPLWKPLLFWLAIASPLLLTFGQGRLTALGWSVMTVWTAFELLDRFHVWLEAHSAFIALPLAMPALIATGAAWGLAHSRRQVFWHAILFCALVIALFGAAFAPMAWWYTGAAGQAEQTAWFWRYAPWLWLAAGGCIAWLWRQARFAGVAHVLLACLVAFSLPPLLPATDAAGEVLSALVFSGLWAIAAWAASRHRQPAAFKLAIAMIAVRLIIIYFEVFGSLLETGVGLILSGIVVIGVASAAVRLARRWKPGTSA